MYTVVPIDRISLPAAMTTIADKAEWVHLVGQPTNDNNEQFEAADYFNPEYLEEFEETVESEKQKTEPKRRGRRSNRRKASI